MFFRFLESFNGEPLLLYLGVIGIAIAGGGIPPIIERNRRRKIENSLPGLLESLASSVGAGHGLQEAMMEQAKNMPGLLSELLKQTLEESHASDINSALTSFSAKTRSSQVQRVMMLIETAMDQDAPLQVILESLSHDYERLNDLINRRENELLGRGILIIMFVSIGLPGLIAFIVGLFAPASSGFKLDDFNSTFSTFFAAASAVGVGVSGRMLGRLKSYLWFLPLWMAISMGLYLGAVKAIGGG
jgi:pilus assembly protein TadC